LPGAQGVAARRERNGNMPTSPDTFLPRGSYRRLQQIRPGPLPRKSPAISIIAENGIVV
jgi:hypothetical protein